MDIQGNAGVSRNITVGGNGRIQGSLRVGHDLRVDGWLEAVNIKGALKGLFVSEARLNEVYPYPEEGWYAYVGDNFPAELYICENGKWKNTGKRSGEPSVYLDDLKSDFADADSKLSDLECRVSENESLTAKTAECVESVSEGLNLLIPDDYLVGWWYSEPDGMKQNESAIMSNKLRLSPGIYSQRGAQPFFNSDGSRKDYSRLVFFDSKDNVLGSIEAPVDTSFEVRYDKDLGNTCYTRLVLQASKSGPMSEEVILMRGNTVAAYIAPIVSHHCRRETGRVALCVGDSLSMDGNGWFQEGCRLAGYRGINLSVNGSSISDTADGLFHNTLISREELKQIDVLVISHTHNYDVSDSSKIQTSVSDYEDGHDDTDMSDHICGEAHGSANGDSSGMDGLYGACLDYVIKKYKSECRAVGKEARIILCSFWHDGAERYNSSSRKVASLQNIEYCDFAHNIGFSYRHDSPSGNPIPESARYCENGYNNTFDLTIGDVRYKGMGWHPTRDPNSVLAKRMGGILSNVLVGGSVIGDTFDEDLSRGLESHGYSTLQSSMSEINGEQRGLDDYAGILTDADGRICGAVHRDGRHILSGEVSTPGLVREVIREPESSCERMLCDGDGRILAYTDSEGLHLPGMSSAEKSEEYCGEKILSAITDEDGKLASWVDENGHHSVGTLQTPGGSVHQPQSARILQKALLACTDKRSYYDPSISGAILYESGSWHREAIEAWKSVGMFSIHDDDLIDRHIPSSSPSAFMTGGGYQGILYPLLASLGLRGCLAVEGQRCGMTSNPPVPNANCEAALRLQNEAGWELMAHSMTARYDYKNYYVEGLESDLAQEILSSGEWHGAGSNSTTSVYDGLSGRQYTIKSDKSGWTTTPKEYIKCYVRDYRSGKLKMYNPSFPIDYQWGELFRLSEKFGMRIRTWVTPAETSSHANVPLINAICPWGFANFGEESCNLPPLRSGVTRLPVEGLWLSGYKGETDTDNSYNQSHYNYFKSKIEEAAHRGGWIVLALHAYRPCWVNSLPGALVSEGGTYPDEWVEPLRDMTAYPDSYLDAPVEKGISAWSDWHPCPGTRLYMLWELLKLCKELGMINVTSSEGFERMGNIVSTGFYTGGVELNNDKAGIDGASGRYAHYVMGIDGSESYYSEGNG